MPHIDVEEVREHNGGMGAELGCPFLEFLDGLKGAIKFIGDGLLREVGGETGDADPSSGFSVPQGDWASRQVGGFRC